VLIKEGDTTVDTKNSSPFAAVLVTSLLLVAVGGVGLALLFILTVPTLGPRWLFFFLVTLAASGLALPFAYFFNIRFSSDPPAQSGVLLREAVFVGLYVDLVIWLRFGKVLNFAIGVFVLVAFVFIELLLRWRERNRFAPGADSEEEARS
jgi:hypothetical protein